MGTKLTKLEETMMKEVIKFPSHFSNLQNRE